METATTLITATRDTAHPGARPRSLITQLVVAALTLAAPALCLAQAAGGEDTGSQPGQGINQGISNQGISSVSTTPAAQLPGATLPGETPTGPGPEPAELARYGIAAGIGETDNVNLSSTDPKSQTIAATDLDFDLRRTGSRLDAAALGNFTDLYYVQGAYGNQVLGRFDGLATAKLWSDRLKWMAGDDYGEAQTDPFAAVTPTNLQRVNVFTTGPDLMLRPSYATFIHLDARYSKLSYQTSPFDGHDLVGSAELGRQLSSLSSLSLVVQAAELRFDNTTVNTDYDRREAYGRYLVKGARTSIDAQAGVTQANDVASSWKTSPLVRVLLTRTVSPFSLVTLGGGTEYTDAGNSFSSLRAGAGGGIAVAPVTQSTGNYRRDYGTAGWGFSRLRTTLGFTGTWERDTYDLQSLYDVTRTGLGLSLGRALTPKLSVNINGSADRYQYTHQGFTDKFGTVGGGLVYRPGRWIILYARYDHSFRRSGGSSVGVPLLGGGASYDENRVFVMIGYRPHSDTEAAGGSGFGGGAAP